MAWGRFVAGLLESMSPGRMTDVGMWAWAGVLTLVGLALSYAIAVGWQRWREGQKRA